MKSKKNLNAVFRFLRAILFSLLLNLPSLAQYFHYDGYIPLQFLNQDEYSYLQLAKTSAQGFVRPPVYYEHQNKGSMEEVHARLPHAYGEVLVGKFGNAVGLPTKDLGLVLDLVIAVLAYMSFFWLFSLLGASSFTAEFSAFFTLAFPWTLFINKYINLQIPGLDFLIPAKYILTASLPVQRGVSTQLSYPFFALVLCSGILALRAEKKTLYWWAAAGLGSGLLLSLYFFAWVAASGLLISLLIISLLYDRRVFSAKLQRFVAASSVFAVSHLSALALHRRFLFPVLSKLVVPGTAATGTVQAQVSENIIFQYWFMSLELLVLLVLLILLMHRSPRSGQTHISAALAVSCIILEFVTQNLQPALNLKYQPWHIPLLFSQPLLGGLLVSLFLSRYFSLRRMQLLTKILCWAVFTFFLLKSWGLSRLMCRAENEVFVKESVELIELLKFVKQGSSADDVIVSPPLQGIYESREIRKGRPFDLEISSNVIWALLERPVLHQISMTSGASFVEDLKRELTKSWIYRGKIAEIHPYRLNDLDLPGDVFSLTRTARIIKRAQYAAKMEKLKETYLPCNMVQDFRIDYLIVKMNGQSLEKPWLDGMVMSVWQGPKGIYTLLRFDRQAAKKILCP